jgi:flagellar biogenesis protein FliO
MMWAAVKMIFGLGAVLGLLFLVVRFSKRRGLGGNELLADSWVRVLSVKPIAPRKFISLIAIGGEVLVVGIAESQMTLLDKIGDKELAEKMLTTQPTRLYPFSWFEGWLAKRNQPSPTGPRVLHGK